METLIAFGIVGVFGVVCVTHAVYSAKKKNREMKDICSPIHYSIDTVLFLDELDKEFRLLVREIAKHLAMKEGGVASVDNHDDHHHHHGHHHEDSKKVLISRKDLEKAFLLALREVGQWNYGCGACQNGPLDRIKELRKKYQPKTP